MLQRKWNCFSKSMKLFILKDQSTLYSSVIITLNKYPFLYFTLRTRKGRIITTSYYISIAKAKGHECGMVVIMHYIYTSIPCTYMYNFMVKWKTVLMMCLPSFLSRCVLFKLFTRIIIWYKVIISQMLTIEKQFES